MIAGLLLITAFSIAIGGVISAHLGANMPASTIAQLTAASTLSLPDLVQQGSPDALAGAPVRISRPFRQRGLCRLRQTFRNFRRDRAMAIEACEQVIDRGRVLCRLSHINNVARISRVDRLGEARHYHRLTRGDTLQ